MNVLAIRVIDVAQQSLVRKSRINFEHEIVRVEFQGFGDSFCQNVQVEIVLEFRRSALNQRRNNHLLNQQV